MTRINLVPPAELMDQHLFAEFREIKMVPKSLKRSVDAALKRGEPLSMFLIRIPPSFTLNKGHVCFFYDKGVYLHARFNDIVKELDNRGINYDKRSVLDELDVFKTLGREFNKDYVPTKEALQIIRQRIQEKIAMKPSWYRYGGARV